MNDIGHNQPPDMSIMVGEVAQNLSDWMKDNPVIADESKAREAKIKIDVGKLAIADLEAERTAKVKPLNEQVKTINEGYRAPRELLRKVLDELERRVTDFLAKEEAKRIVAAEEARKAAEIAEQLARGAERSEQIALSNAAAGELDVSVMDAVAEADRSFTAYQKAERQAQIAEREAGNVRLGGGFTRALSLRSTEVLHVTDLMAAVGAMKESARITEAVIKAARSYKKVYGKYPPGIEVQIERKV